MVVHGGGGRVAAAVKVGSIRPGSMPPGSVTTVASAYSLTGGAWQRGPGRIYDRLAEVVVEHAPVPVDGAVSLDARAGTGAASRALFAAGAARVFAVDVALGMLTYDAATRPPAVVGDLVTLPFADGSFD